MKNKIIIILDNIRSLNNIGSIFRTCDAFNIEKIFLCGICGKPPNKEIHKTALGSTEFVKWEYQKNTSDVIHDLKKIGYNIISIEQADESMSLKKVKDIKNKKLAFIFGNEVKGISKEIQNKSDYCIEIPQYGIKKSMNVTICVGIILWDFLLKEN